ncbi:hypothetical protein [Herbiconiux sp.]|uniref:hypothetical protein n=1 Tax=Herbiconiux sp. TaxID=1871186 RepID=UPI0025BDD66B|nr:hypothetical protein [Herbiconiux sp.]
MTGGRVRVGVVALAVPLLLLLSGCSLIGGAQENCLPHITVSPSPAVAGEPIVLASADVCGADVPAEGWTVVVGHAEQPPISVTTAEPFDGSFEVTVDLPPDFPAGRAYVNIRNWDYSTCNDTGSCATLDVGFEVVAE